MNAVPEFWDWLLHHGEAGTIKMPLETYEEVKEGSQDGERDLLFDWVQQEASRQALLFATEVDPALVRQVLNDGYAADLTDDEIEQVGRDPFLIAYGLASPADRCVVSNESSAPAKQRQNRRIPDVCSSIGVVC